MVESTICARHSDVETALRCSKCDTLICSKCLVQTPVGARCPVCANVKRLPTFDVARSDYLKAAGVAAGAGIALGVVWAFIPLGGFFSFILALAVGYGLGELISRSVNRKSSVGLQVVAGLGAILALAIRWIVISVLTAAPFSDPSAAIIVVAAALLSLALSPMIWLMAAIGVFGAVMRLRR